MRRVGSRTLWALVGLELLVLFGALIWTLGIVDLPHTPFAASGNVQPVKEAIIARLSGIVDDPLVEVRSGVTARESSLRGFRSNGETYFYYLEGAQNFDPLSSGRVKASDVEILLREESGPQPLVIYRIR
ncbi:hypothetical protein HC891_03240 [Candidatus Gracilibacteria bacterium]|nr:hypothetical protein [Candidatus Gracilibacteria bacterium]